jgi:branched-chain amino acid transport system ATP-binding protein
MSGTSVLECRNLAAGYDKVAVARDIELAVDRRQILAILGPNGAGKTTLLHTVAGFLAPLAGSVLVDGQPIRPGSARRMNRAGVILVPSFRALFTELTPIQHLQLGYRRGGASVEEVLDLFPPLERRARLRTAELSGGEQQMLALGRALVQAPKILLIDEMSMGLAPVVVESLMPLIRKVADEKQAAVVLVEQHVQLALEVADRAMVMVHGSVVKAGPADEIRRDPGNLEALYLGGSPTTTSPAPGSSTTPTPAG